MTDSDRSDCPDCYNNNATFYSYYECDECYEPIGAVDAVPIGVLEELIDEWESRRDRLSWENGSTYYYAADELQDVINDYGDADE